MAPRMRVGSSTRIHAAVTAGILKNTNRTVLVAHDKQRHAEKVHWLGVTTLRNILSKTDAGPVF